MSVAGCRLPVRKAGTYIGIPARKALVADFSNMPLGNGEAARRFLSQVLGSDDISCSESDPGLECCYVDFGNAQLFRLRTACDIAFAVNSRHHMICFCEDGQASYAEDGVPMPVAGERAAILASPLRGRFTCTAGTTLIGVIISEAHFRREASAVLKGISSARLGPTRGFDIAVNPGRVFRDAAHMLLTDIDTAQVSRNNKSIRLMFGRLIVYALLQLADGGALEKAEGKNNVAPRHIKRAEEYIKANLTEPLDNMLLAQVAQVSPRSLYRGFVHFRGVTPARYIQELRLDEAHRLLTAEGRSYDIREIAEQTGFRSYASFWRSYVRKFGTPPSKSRPLRSQEEFSSS